MPNVSDALAPVTYTLRIILCFVSFWEFSQAPEFRAEQP